MSPSLLFTFITVALVIFGAVQTARIGWLIRDVEVFFVTWDWRSNRHCTDLELMAAVRRLRSSVLKKDWDWMEEDS